TAFTFVIAGLIVSPLTAIHAQQKPMDHQHGMAGHEVAQGKTPEIFCPTMKTGQLCSHGTADALALSGAQRDRWIQAVQRYNKAVNEATRNLQEESKSVLTPQQAAEVGRWFAKGLNPEINQVLEASLRKPK